MAGNGGRLQIAPADGGERRANSIRSCGYQLNAFLVEKDRNIWYDIGNC
jgi:hypothetical protein